MGGFRTVFGGFFVVGVGIFALIYGIINPALYGSPFNNFVAGFMLHRWSEAIPELAVNQLFAGIWIFGLIMWIVCTLLMVIGGIVGFSKGGYSGLLGAIIFFLFDIIVSVASISLTTYGTSSIFVYFGLPALIILILGGFGGILQASAKK